MGLNDQSEPGGLPSATGGGVSKVGDCISRPMAERRVLTDDARMVWMAQLSDAARHSAMVSRCELVGVEQTVVWTRRRLAKRAVQFAARLARRLGWRLSLVPLPEAATEDERLGHLLAASTRDRAGFVVTQAVRSGAGAAALVELSRDAPPAR